MTAAASPCRLPLRRGLLPIQTAPNAPAGWKVWNIPERCSVARGGSESGRSDWGDQAIEVRLRSDHTGSPAASARAVVQGRLA